MLKHKFTMAVLLLVCFALTFTVFVGCGMQDQSGNVEGKSVFGKSSYTDFSALLKGKTESSVSGDTEIRVIVELEGSSLADEFVKAGFGSLSEYIVSDAGRRSVSEKLELQTLVKECFEGKVEAGFKYGYTTLLNGFSATIKAADLETVKGFPYVKNVAVSDSYALPETTVTDVIGNISRGGILNNDSAYNGEGTVIAIIDTGLDTDHPAFNTYPEVAKFDADYVAEIFDSLYINESLGLDYYRDSLYYNAKVPFGFDYADKDTTIIGDEWDVNYYGGYHGTHVAGIAAGDGGEITGVAPKAQIAVMKVFGDYVGSAYTTDILAALCDAAALGVDVINMSLGSGAGLPEEIGDGYDVLNAVYDLIEMMGINLCVSAGNDGSSSVYANGGAGNIPTDPDNGVIASPSSYSQSLTVASCYGGGEYYFVVDGVKVGYRPAVREDGSQYPFAATLCDVLENDRAEFVIVPGTGSESDYEGLDVNGKIAVVTRGEISFTEKQKTAAGKGAVACVILNNQTGFINAQVTELAIPTCTVTIDYAEILGSADTAVMEFGLDYGYIEISDFSAIGPLPDLQMGVDITAPGGDIYSSVPLTYYDETGWDYGNGYAYASGTSMASPNMAGATAVVRQYVRTLHPEFTAREVTDRVWKLTMSTADILTDIDGVPYTPRKQGAGMVNISSATTARGYLEVTGTDRVRLNLGDDKEREGVYTLRFNVVNDCEEDLSYNIDLSVFTESVDEIVGTIACKAYLFDGYEYSVSVGNGSFDDGVITVAAGETASVRIVVVLSDEDKAYMDDNFENGIYVEGFVTLESVNDVDLSIPFLSYYGNWDEPRVLDGSVYEKDSVALTGNALLGSRVVNNGLFDTDVQYTLGGYDFYVVPAGYKAPETSADKIALSYDGKIDTFVVSALRAMRTLKISLCDAITGVEYYVVEDEGFRKAYVSDSGSLSVLEAQQKVAVKDFGFSNNQSLVARYEVTSYAIGAETQIMEFPVFIDFEAPTLEDVEVVTEDGGTKLVMKVYDNHYLMCYSLLTYDEEGNYTYVYDYAIPVSDFVKGQTNEITVDITEYVSKLDGGRFAIGFIDYAFNSVAYNIGLGLEGETENNAEMLSEDGKAAISTSIFSVSKSGDYTVNSEESEFVIEDGVLTAYNGQGGEVVIPEGVTAIGEGVFKNNRSITKVILPEGLKSIGASAFYYATGIERVVLPSTLETIGNEAFLATLSMGKINLGDTAVTNIGSKAFQYSGITEIVIPANADITLDEYAFSCNPSLRKAVIEGYIDTLVNQFVGCQKLSEIVVNGNIGTVSGYTFSDNSELQKLEFFGTVGYFGTETFFGPADDFGYPNGSLDDVACGMRALKEVVFHKDVGGFYGYAFNGCEKLEKVVFEGSLGYVGEYAFQDCPSLLHFEASEGNTSLDYDKETGMLYNIGRTEMYKPGNFDYDGIFEIPETIEKCPRLGIGPYYCSAFTVIMSFGEDECTNRVSFMTAMTNFFSVKNTMPLLKGIIVPAKFTDIPLNFANGFTNLASVEFKGDVETIGRKAFAYTGLTSFTLPESVVSVKNGAFANCADLVEFNFNEGLESWGSGTVISGDFDNCKSLKEIRIPDFVTEVSYMAFRNCESLERVYMGANVTGITLYGTFINCYNLKEIVTDSVFTTIASSSFENCYELEEFEPKEGLSMIGDNAFTNCYALNARIPSSVWYIGDNAFKNCISMEYADIPEGISSIDLGNVFEGCTGIREYNIPESNAVYRSVEGVVYSYDLSTLVLYPAGNEASDYGVLNGTAVIDENAFAYAKNLKHVKAETVEAICPSAFAYSSVISVDDADNLVYIGDYAFANAADFRDIDYSEVGYIGESAFRGTAICEVVLTGAQERIGLYAFADCPNLVKVVIDDDAGLFDFISVFSGDDIEEFVIGSNNAFFACDEYGTITSKDGSVIYSYASHGEETIEIEEGVRFIAKDAFRGNNEIRKLVLPSTLEAIGANAFYGCDNLGEIVFKSEKAPVLYGDYDEEARYPYANFVRKLDSGNPLDVKVYAPDDESYGTIIWRLYFKEIFFAN